MARESGWILRQPRKILPENFLISLLACLGTGYFSYLCWAFKYAALFGVQASRQAFFKRTSGRLVVFLIKVLEAVLLQHFPQNGPFVHAELFALFPSVFLQDSTNFHLDDSLFKTFPGNYSRGKRKAVLKVDTILDIKRWSLARWEIRNFCQNDQSNALLSLDKVKSGSLLIRDLGYFTLQTIAELNQRSIHFLYRLKNGINIYCPDTQKKITLTKVLAKKRTTSMLVLLGEARIPVRLVAIPLDHKTSEYRKRKALKNRDKRLNPNQESIKRLGWNIFITSVPEEVWTNKQVEQAYKVRWNIELLFKTWKSNTPIVEAIGDSHSEDRIRMLLMGLLLYTFLVLLPLLHRAWKLIDYTAISWTKLLTLVKWIGPIILKTGMLQKLIYYAQYEKRKRNNLVEALIGIT